MRVLTNISSLRARVPSRYYFYRHRNQSRRAAGAGVSLRMMSVVAALTRPMEAMTPTPHFVPIAKPASVCVMRLWLDDRPTRQEITLLASGDVVNIHVGCGRGDMLAFALVDRALRLGNELIDPDGSGASNEPVPLPPCNIVIAGAPVAAEIDPGEMEATGAFTAW